MYVDLSLDADITRGVDLVFAVYVALAVGVVTSSDAVYPQKTLASQATSSRDALPKTILLRPTFTVAPPNVADRLPPVLAVET